MKKGDLVRDNARLRVLLKPENRYPTRNRVGVIIEQVFDRLAQNNKVYKVLWQDGTIGNNVWDYDLGELTSEKR